MRTAGIPSTGGEAGSQRLRGRRIEEKKEKWGEKEGQAEEWPARARDLRTNNHCHAFIPASPFINETPVAIRPPKALETRVSAHSTNRRAKWTHPDAETEALKIAIRVARSEGVYQKQRYMLWKERRKNEVGEMSVNGLQPHVRAAHMTPGKYPASAAPNTILTAMSPS